MTSRAANSLPAAAPTKTAAATTLAAALLGLAGAWVAAGSTGLLSHPLRHGLTVAALIFSILLAWPQGKNRWVALGLLAAAVIAAALLIASAMPPLGILAVGLILLALAEGAAPGGKQSLRTVAEAAVLLAVYRIAITSIPWLWMIADGIGGALGKIAGTLSGQPLWVGATFAGLDFLVPMFYLAIVIPWRTRTADARLPWYAVAGIAVAAVLICQMLYLIVLSFGPAMLAAECMKAPPVFKPPAGATPNPPGLVSHLRMMIPWNVPLLAGVLQLGVAGVLLWRIGRAPQEQTGTGRGLAPSSAAGSTPSGETCAPSPSWTWAGAAAAWLLAVAAPFLVAFFPTAPSLSGKKIVFYEKGFLNWLKPEHGQYGRLTIGMYGMVPTFLESYGAKPLISPDLSAEDLKDADAVVLLFPNKQWKDGQLERLWEYVNNGGTLLVAGEHTIWEREKDEEFGTKNDSPLIDVSEGRERSRFNEVVQPTNMRVNFDSAQFAIGGWLQSYEALAHPTTAGIRDEQNDFGVVIGASLDVRFPARPVINGRWGWADPGDLDNEKRALMGDDKYGPGEKLGDVVLAAEQQVGKGKIVLFGDTSGFTNGLTVGCHEYTSRLYAYLADSPTVALPEWRLGLAMIVLAGLAVLLIAIPRPAVFAAAAVGLAASFYHCTAVTHRAWELLPDGRTTPDGSPRVPNNLAYIDTSHLGAYSPESWRPEGLMGFTMTLMRNGFLTLHLSEMTPERLEGARLLVSVAPAKPFTPRERKMIEKFVTDGGIFISTVGYEEREPSRELLADLGFHIGQRPEDDLLGREPQPLGHFKAPFFNGGSYLAYVRFFAGWKVICDDPKRLPITFSRFGDEMIVMRRVGKGLVVVVGDTFFAANKNLENEGGEPFEGKRENALFWRWLLALLRNGLNEGQPWIPPAAECTPTTPAPAAGEKPKAQEPPPDESMPAEPAPDESMPAEPTPDESVPAKPAPAESTEDDSRSSRWGGSCLISGWGDSCTVAPMAGDEGRQYNCRPNVVGRGLTASSLGRSGTPSYIAAGADRRC